jgi:hypothetical protein
MDYKVKLTKCQNKHHHGVYLTRGPSGPRGRPARVLVTSAWDIANMSLHQFTRKDLRLEGGGTREECSASHVVGRPAVHLLQTNLARSVETRLCPYISSPTVDDSTTHSTCTSPFVKVLFSSSSAAETLSGVESRV